MSFILDSPVALILYSSVALILDSPVSFILYSPVALIVYATLAKGKDLEEDWQDIVETNWTTTGSVTSGRGQRKIDVDVAC